MNNELLNVFIKFKVMIEKQWGKQIKIPSVLTGKVKCKWWGLDNNPSVTMIGILFEWKLYLQKTLQYLS